ncbi:hypothetical protein AAGG74_17770 [Bacillus mexicanus]|uniref:hypothetical protein n=1 Tax=Bacillus mexicanus TaxID=2834415 RepID=UPI003D25C204
MFVEIDLDELKDIINLFEEDNGKEVEAYIDKGRLFVNGEENELMLRLNKHTNILTIARIQFKNTRVGNGQKMLEILKEYGKKNGYKQIMIESILTEEGYNFAKKHGFEKKDYFGFMENMIEGDYYLNI